MDGIGFHHEVPKELLTSIHEVSGNVSSGCSRVLHGGTYTESFPQTATQTFKILLDQEVSTLIDNLFSSLTFAST